MTTEAEDGSFARSATGGLILASAIMIGKHQHISVCVCTFQRPALLRRLLEYLEQQQTNDQFTFSVVVADNDFQQSAKHVVTEFASTSRIAVKYSCEPSQNIALARNEALKHATGEFVAFIDDDEYPENGWLAAMLQACETYQSAGVLGPVLPKFEEPPPKWVIDGCFWHRPEHRSGEVMSWRDCRTGNVLFRRSIVADSEQPFDPIFRTGAEDIDFFRRMIGLGHVFRWYNEGVVYETVPKERCTRTYLLKRAMLRGRHSVKLPAGRMRLVARSLLAMPIYLAMLPFTLLLGQHIFMKYCIRFCDHAGRVLTVLSLNPITER